MAVKTVVEGSNVSASQLSDLFRQLADRSVDGQALQAFLEHRDPWPLKARWSYDAERRVAWLMVPDRSKTYLVPYEGRSLSTSEDCSSTLYRAWNGGVFRSTEIGRLKKEMEKFPGLRRAENSRV